MTGTERPFTSIASRRAQGQFYLFCQFHAPWFRYLNWCYSHLVSFNTWCYIISLDLTYNFKLPIRRRWRQRPTIHVCADTEVRGMYRSKPLATLAPEGVDGEYQSSTAFLQERSSTHHTGSSVPVWTGAESVLPTRFRTLKLLTRSEWLKPTTLYRPPVGW